MDEALRALVWRRADNRCEYCRMPHGLIKWRHQIDHIIARQHRGQTAADNLALICQHCNLHKGPNIAGIDPETGDLSPLFHPRRHVWDAHFAWRDAKITGSSAEGRTTAEVLLFNEPLLVATRKVLIMEGSFRFS